MSLVANATTNTNATDHNAWGDTSGWWDFYATNSVMVKGTRLEGFASSSISEISLDCFTTSAGNICGSSNYGVCNGPGPHNSDGTCPSGDATGILSGWGWNDTIGWISFDCDQSSHGGSNNCGISNYGVTVDPNGDFHGYAWNDIEGWISFNCLNNSSCAASNFKTNTAWRPTSTLAYLQSSIFDTQVTNGAILNSIIWQGTQPSGTSVDFQIAVATSTDGPWNYTGPSGNTIAYYSVECPIAGAADPGAGPNKAICIDKSQVINYRYLRYKIRLKSDLAQTLSPRIDDIILNWSQ